MYTEGNIRAKLLKLQAKNSYIHIDVNMLRPRLELSNVQAKILGVYNHIFQIEVENNGRKERHSIQYGEVIAGIVKIAEL